jgi:hypothetical protein
MSVTYEVEIGVHGEIGCRKEHHTQRNEAAEHKFEPRNPLPIVHYGDEHCRNELAGSEHHLCGVVDVSQCNIACS